MATDDDLARVRGAADRQLGLLTTAQVERLGADLAGLVSNGHLVKLNHDVFEVGDNLTAMPLASVYGAWLALRPDTFAWERPGADGDLTADAVVSHESAASLFRLGAPGAGRKTFTVPAAVAAPRGVRVLVAALDADDVMVHRGVPVTTPHRTIVDLVLNRTDHGVLARILRDAVDRDLVDLMAVYRDLQPFGGRYHIPGSGPEFVSSLLYELDEASLSDRNRRAIASLSRGR